MKKDYEIVVLSLYCVKDKRLINLMFVFFYRRTTIKHVYISFNNS